MRSELRHLALLIDMDQEDPSLFGSVLGKAATYGLVTVRRAYGRQDKLSPWKECLMHHRITPVANYADGRNAADATMIIDAMDLLHYGTVDGFCIVASDHIFTGLVKRLQEHGVFVAGIGRRQASESLKKSLGGLFTIIEDLNPPMGSVYRKAEYDLIDQIQAVIGDQGEYVLMSVVGEHLVGINYRSYCHGDLMSLVRSYPDEFIICDGTSIRKPPGIYVGISPPRSSRSEGATCHQDSA